MIVLSLFDGISCAQQALKELGVTDIIYYASEIDKYAISITQKNHPNTIQVGDVTTLQGKDYKNVDLLIGGSPCQGFSFAGKQLNFEDVRSKLFFKFVDILKEVKPKYFILENVNMKKEYQDIISKLLDVKPIMINASLVSAQNRKRLFWTNIVNVTQPKDKKILLKDIIDTNCIAQEKMSESKRWGNHYGTIETIKSPTLMAIGKCDCLYLKDKNRFLSPIECERLQSLPDNYTERVSNSRRYKTLGNAFNCEVIKHILKQILY